MRMTYRNPDRRLCRRNRSAWIADIFTGQYLGRRFSRHQRHPGSR